MAHTGNSADEILGAVDGVEHPLAAGENRCATELFAEHDVVRPPLGQRLAEHGLHRAVGIGHRGEVGFGVDAEVERAEPVQRQRVGLVGQLQRQVPGHRAPRSCLPSYHVGVFEIVVILVLLGCSCPLLGAVDQATAGHRWRLDTQGSCLSPV